MKTSGILLLLAALVALGCALPALTPVVHAGSCPTSLFKIGIVCEKEMITVECNDDSTCGSDEKCCSVPMCTTKCVPAVVVNPGTCPAVPAKCSNYEKPVTACNNDGNCKNGQKCCDQCGGKTCTEPAVVIVNPGTCPAVPAKCSNYEKPVTACNNDGSCKNGQKCCDQCGGKTCTDPAVVIVNPGTCPAVPAKCSNYEKPVTACNNDGNCKNGQKCCDQCGGKTCTDPATVIVNPGTCPAVPAKCSNYEKPVTACKNDGSCKNGQKCCDQCGGKTCTDPAVVIVNPGTCPAVPAKCSNYEKPVTACNNDGNCKNGQKCCDQCGGKTCTDPAIVTVNPGTCPAVPAKCSNYEKPVTACKNDGSCKNGQKCCDQCGGKTCTDPAVVIVNPGTCPAVPAKCSNYEKPVTACNNDGNCKNGQKCCDQCGGKTCTDPAVVIVNPGTCPAVPAKCSNYEKPVTACKNDGNCKNGQKCCDQCGGKTCTNPATVIVKPGTCPAIMAKCVMPLPEDECSSDGGCDGNKKCCKLCNQKCMDPETVNPGTCPGAPLWCPDYEKPVTQCTQDGACKKGEKCCEQCGSRKCIDVTTITVKAGSCPAPMLKCKEYKEDPPLCDNDAECQGKQKCCNQCGKKCTNPVTVAG